MFWPFHCRGFSALLLLLCLVACSGRSPESDGQQIAQKMYVDARLGFAIEYPGNWQRIKPDPAVTNLVGWQSPRVENGQSVASLRVFAFPAPKPQNLEKTVQDHLAEAKTTIIQKEPFEISSTEIPSLSVETPRRHYWFLAAEGDTRWYLLKFSTLPEHFDSYLSLFEEVASSFATLP